jgi:hypothetical protein
VYLTKGEVNMNKAKWLIGAGLVGIVLLFAYSIRANQSQSWTWTPNTESDLVGYKLYQVPDFCRNVSGPIPGPAIRDIAASLVVGSVPFTQTDIADGTLATCNALTAYDNAVPPNESAQSPKVEKVYLPQIQTGIILTVTQTGVQNPTSADAWNVVLTSNIVGAYTSDVYVNGAFHHTDSVDPRCIWRLGTNTCSGGNVVKPNGTYLVEFVTKNSIGVELARKSMTVVVQDKVIVPVPDTTPPKIPTGLQISQIDKNTVVVSCTLKTECADIKIASSTLTINGISTRKKTLTLVPIS